MNNILKNLPELTQEVEKYIIKEALGQNNFEAFLLLTNLADKPACDRNNVCTKLFTKHLQ